MHINLEDYQDVQVFGDLFIGSDKQKVELIMDTGSSVFWVPSTSCKSCNKQVLKFNEKSSSSFQAKKNSEVSLGYGSGYAYGFQANDEVCLNNDTCIKDYKLSVINQVTSGIKNLAASGICGLGPHAAQQSDHFIEKLKKEGIIDKAIFSFSLGENEFQDRMTVGGYDLERFADGPLFWHKTESKYQWWVVNADSYGISGSVEEKTENPIVVDTGTSFNFIPYEIYYKLLAELP